MSKNEISLEKSKDFKQHVEKAARLGKAKQFLFDEVKKHSRTSPGGAGVWNGGGVTPEGAENS